MALSDADVQKQVNNNAKLMDKRCGQKTASRFTPKCLNRLCMIMVAYFACTSFANHPQIYYVFCVYLRLYVYVLLVCVE